MTNKFSVDMALIRYRFQENTLQVNVSMKELYYERVWEFTNAHCLERPFGYAVDHVIPISYGFKHHVPPYIIGSIENLQVIPNSENIRKNSRITKQVKAMIAKLLLK